MDCLFANYTRLFFQPVYNFCKNTHFIQLSNYLHQLLILILTLIISSRCLAQNNFPIIRPLELFILPMAFIDRTEEDYI